MLVLMPIVPLMLWLLNFHKALPNLLLFFDEAAVQLRSHCTAGSILSLVVAQLSKFLENLFSL